MKIEIRHWDKEQKKFACLIYDTIQKYVYGKEREHEISCPHRKPFFEGFQGGCQFFALSRLFHSFAHTKKPLRIYDL